MSDQRDASFQAKELWIKISKGGSNSFETVDVEYGKYVWCKFGINILILSPLVVGNNVTKLMENNRA